MGELASIDHKQTSNGSGDYRAEPSSQQSDQAPSTNYSHICPALKEIYVDHLACSWAMKDNLCTQGSTARKGQSFLLRTMTERAPTISHNKLFGTYCSFKLPLILSLISSCFVGDWSINLLNKIFTTLLQYKQPSNKFLLCIIQLNIYLLKSAFGILRYGHMHYNLMSQWGNIPENFT